MNRIERLRGVVNHLESSRKRMGTATEADWIVRNAHVVLQQNMNKISFSGSMRDSCMAANVSWIVDSARKGDKVVLWAHNMHVAKRTGAMGGWLAKRYGKDMVVVGFAANEGMYTAWNGKVTSDNPLTPGTPASIEHFAHETGVPRFLLDLREAEKAPGVQKQLGEGVMMRSIGAVPTAEQFTLVPILSYYDVLAWVDRTEASRPLR